jgi:large subunit ribosomal protein L19
MAKNPDVRPGDLVKVYTKIIEGEKERLAPFQGVVIKTKGRDIGKTFTVRKVSAGIGIERIFPVHSPMIAKVEIKKKGKVRRAKLTYLRQRKGRRMKIKEAALPTGEAATVLPETAPPEVVPEEASPEPAPEKTPPPPKTEEKPGEGTPGQETVEKA